MGSAPRGISASRGAAVLGLSEFQTPLEVWQRIMEEREPGWNAAHGYALPPEPDSAAMRWGTAFESAVIELAEREQRKKIIDKELLFTINAYPGDDIFQRTVGDYGLPNFITCHIDGRYKMSHDCDPLLLHEGKTTSAMAYREKWGEPGTDHIPLIYQVQVQHQMLCTAAKEAVVSVLVFQKTPDELERMGWNATQVGKDTYALRKNGAIYYTPYDWADIFYAMGDFHQYPVKANPEAQRLMVNAYSEFWHKHILAGIPPEPRNYDDVKRLFTEPIGTIVCDAAMAAWWREYDAIRKEIGKSGNAVKRQEKLKLRILNETRKLNPVMDDESQEKVIFRDSSGNKLGQFSKTGGFR
jgi:hypothetical protein